MAFVVVWEAKGASVRYAGHSNETEVVRAAQCIKSNERFSDLRYVVHDFSGCSSVSPTTQAMQELAADDYAASLSNSRVLVAVVTDAKGAVCPLVHAYIDAQFSPYPVQLFATRDDAYEWLSQQLIKDSGVRR